MSDEHLGIVRLPFGDRTVPLRFTYGRMGQMGREGIVSRLQAVASGEEGDGKALGELLELASGGDLNASDMQDGDAPAANLAIIALHEAWALFWYGPARRAPEGSANPRNRLKTLLKTLFRRGAAQD